LISFAHFPLILLKINIHVISEKDDVLMVLNSIKNWIVPQDKIFFELLSRESKNMLEGVKSLDDMLRNYKDVEQKRDKVKDLETKGDDIVHEIFTHLNKTFIVPIDHTDISSLASSVDDIIDLSEGVATRLFLYRIKKPAPALLAISKILVMQAEEIDACISEFRSRRKYPDILERCIKINSLENRADDIYKSALADLFTKKDAIEIIKTKELYDTIERATDCCEDAANIIKDIVMKHS